MPVAKYSAVGRKVGRKAVGRKACLFFKDTYEGLSLEHLSWDVIFLLYILYTACKHSFYIYDYKHRLTCSTKVLVPTEKSAHL